MRAALTLVLAVAALPASAAPEAQVTAALELLEDWQLEEALAAAQQLLATDLDDPEAWLVAARVQHQRGEHLSALALFEAARGAELDTGYVHDLAKGSAAYAAHFETRETPHFRIRYLNKDEIVADYAAPVLESAWAFMSGAPGWDALLTDYPTDVVVTDRNQAPAKLLRHHPEWEYVYSDPLTLVFIRKVPSQDATLARFHAGALHYDRSPLDTGFPAAAPVLCLGSGPLRTARAGGRGAC